MNTHSRKFKRLTTLGLACLAVAIGAALLAASHAPAASGVPSALVTYQPQLATDYNIHLRSLSAGMTPHVSRSAAETTALKQFGVPLKSNVSAFAVSATNTAWGTPQRNGTLKLKISNRPVWVVLIPNYHVQPMGGMKKSMPASFTATLAVLVDARSGTYLMASVVY